MHRQLLLDMVDTNVEFSFAPGVHRKYQRIGRIESLRVGREELVTKSSDHARYWLKLCSPSYPSGKLWREPDIKWFDLNVAPVSKNMQRFALQYRKEPHVEKSAGNCFEQQKTLKIERKVKGFCWQSSWKIRVTDFAFHKKLGKNK